MITMKKELTYERANKLLRYDAETGKMTWRVSHGRVKVGNEAGRVAVLNGIRYRQVRVDGKLHLVHRVCWLLHYGHHPDGEIDHRDGNGLNNRLCNLRDVSRKINMRNSRMHSNNSSGVTGVWWEKRREKWRAQVRTDSGRKHIGYFTDLSASEKAVREFRAKHGFTERHGGRK